MAFRNPQRYVSIIVDGMDQTCTALPNFKPLIRKLSPLVDVHVTGVYNHSSRKMHCMVSHEAIRKDSNLTILSIIQALKHTHLRHGHRNCSFRSVSLLYLVLM